MRKLVLELDLLVGLRHASASREMDLGAAVTLAWLAGSGAVRLTVNEDLNPVRLEDVQEARRIARFLELRMPANQSLLKIALEARPNRVLLSASSRETGAHGRELDLRRPAPGLEPILRGLAEAGIPAALAIGPDLEGVKRLHGLGVPGVEFSTRAIVDLPAHERRVALDRLADAVRLAAKLQLEIGIGGGLGFETLSEVLESCPTVSSVAVGRAAIGRALLVGFERAVRDLRALVG